MGKNKRGKGENNERESRSRRARWKGLTRTEKYALRKNMTCQEKSVRGYGAGSKKIHMSERKIQA